MARDPEIQKIFEITDDSLQGLLGYYLYVINAVGWAPDNGILSSLPAQIPMTHEWVRHYQPQELIMNMRSWFVAYQTRVALVAMVNIFEAATRSFVQRLSDAGHPQTIRDNGRSYKSRLEWVFNKVEKSTYGSSAMQSRLLQLCLDVDHARRLRNISVHNNGIFDEKYEKDAIKLCNHLGLIHQDYQRFKVDKSQPVSLILDPNDYLQLSKSHLELLHFLHHEIQSQDFGETTPYNYREQLKRIEWHRLLFGF